MRHVANPIYDSVFKYLLEDERITKVLLSSLLQKEVVDVGVRRNEYVNETKEGVAILRIDFGAHVKEERNRHFLKIEDDYENPLPIKQLILDRLTMAASDPYVRQSMNVEDEVMRALTRRDNQIAAAEERIEEQQHLISQQKEQLSQKDEQLSQKDEQLSQMQAELERLKELLNNK